MSECLLYLALALSPLPRDAQAAALFRAGQASYAGHDDAGALRLFEASYRLVPLPMLLVDVAQCLRRLGRAREAAESYRRFLESRSGGKQLRVEVWEALDALEPPTPAVVEPAPGERARSAALFQRGRARYQSGDFDGALAAFRLAAGEYPAPDLLVNVAQCLRRLDRPDEAVLSYLQFLDGGGGSRALRREVWDALDETLAELDARLYRLAESAAQLERASASPIDPTLRAEAAATARQIRQHLVEADAVLARVFAPHAH
jgi:tetratricopeptide (TPR) repeat protein